MVGIYWRYLKLVKSNLLEEHMSSFCHLCGLATTKAPVATGTSFNYLQMVWDSKCYFRCNPWQEPDMKTGQCVKYKQHLDFNTITEDQYVCGSTFLDEKNKEGCESMDYFVDKQLYSANKKCKADCKPDQSGQKILCFKDLFGKSECNECDLEFCNTHKNTEIISRLCQSSCFFKYNTTTARFEGSSSQQISVRIEADGFAYYFDQEKLSFKKCTSVDLNIVLKLTSASLGWENCKKCAQTDLFTADSTLQFCFDSDNRYNNTKDKIIPFISADYILLTGYIIGGIALLLFTVSPIILYKLNAISVFFRFWETMQIFYMMSYYVDIDYKLSLFFKQFNFVTFEIFGFKGFIMMSLLKWMLPSDGLRLVTESFRNMNDSQDWAQYLVIFAKYYQKHKIGLFIYDVSALIDLFIVMVFLVILAKIVLKIYLRRKAVSNSENARLSEWMDKLAKISEDLVPTFLTWFFMENYPIFLFFAMSQYYTLPSMADEVGNILILSNKLLLFVTTAFALILLPAYQLGVTLGLFQNETVLMRIKGLGFAKVGSSLRVIYPLSIIRRIMMTMYFSPAVNTGGNTFYCLVVILLEIVEFTVLAFRQVYQHAAVTYLQIFGTLVMCALAFITMFDKLLSSILAVSNEGTDNHDTLMTYLKLRELGLMLFAIFTVLVFLVGILYIILVVRKQVLEADVKMTKKQGRAKTDEFDHTNDFAYNFEMDNLERKGVELAAI